MAGMTVAGDALSSRWTMLQRRLTPQGIAASILLGVLALFVVVPFVLVLINSFDSKGPGEPSAFSVKAWTEVLSDTVVYRAIANTVQLLLVRQAIALVFAVPFAWLIARTDLPHARKLELLFWIAIFLPPLPITQGWILLLDPHYGILNQWAMQLPFVTSAPFNIYSFWGIIWAHIGHAAIAVKIVLLVPAFRNFDASIEEAALVSGATRFTAFRSVVLPIMLPAIAIVAALSFITGLQSFEIEEVLGPQFGFFTFATQVFEYLRLAPAQYAQATAFGSLVLLLILPIIIVQRWLVGRRRYTTVGGQYRGAKLRLGRWRWPAFAAVIGLGLVNTVVPMTLLGLTSFMKLFGFFDLPQPWTLDQWGRVFSDSTFIGSVFTTVWLCLSVGLLGVVVFTMCAYVSVRTTYRLRASVDFLTWLPSTLPGILLGLGFLWLVLGTPLLRPLYGSVLTLIPAVLLAHMTLSTQTMKTVMVQFGRELEEAARVGGGSWLQAVRYVMVPLLAPALVLIFALAFLGAARDVAVVSLLSTTGGAPLALLQLRLLLVFRPESAAVVGVIVALITTTVALAARYIGSRYGLREGDGAY